MYAKPDLRVVLKWTIASSGSVIAGVIQLGLMKINTYWFCFAVAFGVFALLPVLYICVQPRSPRSLNILASAYFLDAFDASWKNRQFLVHVITASALAAMSSLIMQSKSNRHKTTTRLSVRHLFVLTAAIAVTLSAVSKLGGSVSSWVGSMVPFLGYAISTYSIGWRYRSRDKVLDSD